MRNHSTCFVRLRSTPQKMQNLFRYHAVVISYWKQSSPLPLTNQIIIDLPITIGCLK
jgi:hypothetical protein